MPFVLSSPQPFEPCAPSPFTFIIWNLYVTDKLTPLDQETLRQLKIAEIVAILPEEEDFAALNADIGTLPVTVLAYHNNHTPVLLTQQYDGIAKRIDEIAKRPRDQPRNVLVFCNNGYQRSLPFLVYYMITYHKDEFPTVDKAMGCLFSALKSTATYEEKLRLIQTVKQLVLG
jgi:hypothetical protein